MADLVNALLGSLMGGAAVTGESLQAEVAEAGGIPFRRDVKVAFLGRAELVAYLKELIDSEYPAAQARADERLLLAFDLLPAGTDLRALRARLLEDNVAGFYDERPDRRRLYAVSEDRTFTPMNQIVLAHELRHALQDQYRDLHAQLGDDVTDFDDRRLAWMSLLEGDATLVMERFVKLRLGLPGGDDSLGAGMDASGLGAPGLFDLPDAPPVIRDHLMQPYLAGLGLARAIWARGGPVRHARRLGAASGVDGAGAAPVPLLRRRAAAARGARARGARRGAPLVRGDARRAADPLAARGGRRGRGRGLGRRRLAALRHGRPHAAAVAQRVGHAERRPRVRGRAA